MVSLSYVVELIELHRMTQKSKKSGSVFPR